jgi:hypothetical protein
VGLGLSPAPEELSDQLMHGVIVLIDKLAFLVLAMLICAGFAIPAQAAQIYGSLFEDGSSLTEEVVLVVCDSGGRDENGTDEHGGYQLFVKQTGRCTLSLPDKGGASADIYSFEEPVRFDFDLISAPDGGAQLRKR